MRRETGEKGQMSARTCRSLCVDTIQQERIERNSWNPNLLDFIILHVKNVQGKRQNFHCTGLGCSSGVTCSDFYPWAPRAKSSNHSKNQRKRQPQKLLGAFFYTSLPSCLPHSLLWTRQLLRLHLVSSNHCCWRLIDRCPAYHTLWVYYIHDLKQSFNFEITSSHFLLFYVLLHIICQEFNHTWRFSQIWIFYGHKYDLITSNEFIMNSVSHEHISLIQLCRNTLSLFHFKTINQTFSDETLQTSEHYLLFTFPSVPFLKQSQHRSTHTETRSE